jgi:hypothetical protein
LHFKISKKALYPQTVYIFAISAANCSHSLTLFSAKSMTSGIIKLTDSPIKLTDSPIKEWDAVAETFSHSTPARHLAEPVSVDGKFPRSGRRQMVFHFIPEQTASLLRV